MRTWKASGVLSISVLCLTFTSVAARAAAEEAAIKGDLARMQGRWVTRAGERHELIVSLEITGCQVRVEITTPQGLKVQARGEVRLNEKAVPHALDWVGFSGADVIDMPDIPAIYEVGEATLRVCNGGPNNPRPSEFKAGAGVLADLHVFERARPAGSNSSGH
jgi:uncharacterized protein (TIGR03067 family)